jgi:pimeloyl-ACP methyl ester carboxylesterase
VHGKYEWRLYDGLGHFPHEEAPHDVSADLLRWCRAD